MKAVSSKNDNTPDALLGTLQVLRGVAATVVVFHHSIRAFTVYRPADSMLAPPSLFSPVAFQSIGSIGVDIFFVISGFIMIYVSREYAQGLGSAADFLTRRVIRIYPMYLLITLALCGIYSYYVLLKGSPPIYDLQWQRIADSFFFIPSFDEQGEVMPILGVGWTLYYEMYFYICFALALAFARDAIPLALLATITAIVIVSRSMAGESATLKFFQNTIVFEFVLGCALGAVFTGCRVFFRLHPAVFFVPAIAVMPLLPRFTSDDYRFLIWGLPAAFIVAGVLCIEARGGRRWSRSWLIFGDASYAIYLIHIIVIYNFLNRLVLKIPRSVGSGLVTDLAIVCFVMVAIAAGIALNVFVEAPLRYRLRVWHKRIQLKLTWLSLASRADI